MIDRKVLAAAQERNILTADQAEQLVRLAAEQARTEGVHRDSEPLRLVTGFSDIFVTSGIVIFLSAGYILAANAFSSAIAFVMLAGAAWLLAELFTLRHRQALPSIYLVGIFALCIFAGSYLPMRAISIEEPESAARSIFFLFTSLHRLITGFNGTTTPIEFGAAAITALSLAIYYIRFRVPITIAMGGIYLIALVLGGLNLVVPGFMESALRWVLLAAGLALFVLAMRIDMSDPERRTQRADIAFWLHLYSAPLIVNALVNPFLQGVGYAPFGNPFGVLLLTIVLAIVALAIDRRAILVASLLSVGLMFGSLALLAGLFGFGFPIVFLMIGAAILLLGAGWVPMREVVLEQLPQRLVRHLPRPGP